VVAAGIPVVTLVTDVPDSPRSAYVGADNRSAGATAAYLVDQWLGHEAGNVLVTLSRSFFRGEEEREIGFRAMMRKLSPGRSIVEISETDGLDATMYDLVREALDKDPDIKAVYSIGGGNAAIVDAFEEMRRRYSVFIAHDLDIDNKRLLPAGRLSAVLHHDLRRDMRRACYAILRANRALPVPVRSAYSDLFVITPYNLPTGSGEDV
jgi:LacI family transcriptional regulator